MQGFFYIQISQFIVYIILKGMFAKLFLQIYLHHKIIKIK